MASSASQLNRRCEDQAAQIAGMESDLFSLKGYRDTLQAELQEEKRAHQDTKQHLFDTNRLLEMTKLDSAEVPSLRGQLEGYHSTQRDLKNTVLAYETLQRQLQVRLSPPLCSLPCCWLLLLYHSLSRSLCLPFNYHHYHRRTPTFRYRRSRLIGAPSRGRG